ncbi:hypothetical protein ACFQRD_02365 [Brachybacterium sp. GCM10030268]|uniref:hypothetical protein n=1 Tax=Brachybacterium sp. GCM10030268 TaxID=3273382 RepID=UPI003611EB0B
MIAAIRPLLPLLWRVAVALLGTFAALGLCALAGLLIPVPIPIALGLAAGVLWWLFHVGIARAEPLYTPELDLETGYILPDAQDMRVRRLEDLIHGAQPNRRMTSRGLARVLGDIADERVRDPDAPPLSSGLRRLIADARHPDPQSHPVGPIDRRALHRYLRELADGEERDR